MTTQEKEAPRCELNRPTHVAQLACAEWLAACLRLGWRREDLDFLEALWWRHHEYNGKLKNGEAR